MTTDTRRRALSVGMLLVGTMLTWTHERPRPAVEAVPAAEAPTPN